MKAPNRLFFIATFTDGTQIFQNAEDKGSVADQNCFFDALQKQLDVPLVCFLLGAENLPTFGVDLQDGHFEVDRVPFFQHSEPLRDFRLVYYRNVSQHRTINANGSTVDTAEVGYDIGWEADYKGEVIRRFLRIQ